jgi:phosphoglycolate phosphatase
LTLLNSGNIKAVFFDLDGTLVDTAPDMVGALQDLQRSHGVEPVPYELGRSHVSNGAVGLVSLAFPGEVITLESSLLCEFIDRYAARVCDESVLFDGIGALLDRLDDASPVWGVVTNKPSHLTESILEKLALAERSVCTISGDTLSTRKPDPAQLLHASKIAAVSTEECIYVGDAERDIEAGRRAGIATVAVGYGYVVAGDDPLSWGADDYAVDTDELAQIVLKAVNLEP